MNTIYWRLMAVWLLVLAGVLHTQAEEEAEEMPFELTMVVASDEAPVGIEAVVKSADAPGMTQPLELTYLDRQHGWLLTFHEGVTQYVGHEKYHSRAALYRVVEGDYQLQAEWFSGAASFVEKPRFFSMQGKEDRRHLLWVPGRVYGTGFMRHDTVMDLDDDDGMKRVVFEPAPIGYLRSSDAGDPRAVMLDGEGIWKGELNVIHRPQKVGGDQISFTFYVWNKGDGNANPTAGRVDGAYKLIEGEKGLRIEIDTFKRTIFDKS